MHLKDDLYERLRPGPEKRRERSDFRLGDAVEGVVILPAWISKEDSSRP